MSWTRKVNPAVWETKKDTTGGNSKVWLMEMRGEISLSSANWERALERSPRPVRNVSYQNRGRAKTLVDLCPIFAGRKQPRFCKVSVSRPFLQRKKLANFSRVKLRGVQLRFPLPKLAHPKREGASRVCRHPQRVLYILLFRNAASQLFLTTPSDPQSCNNGASICWLLWLELSSISDRHSSMKEE